MNDSFRLLISLTIAGTLAAAIGCQPPSAAPPAAALAGDAITISAAASTKEAIEALAAKFTERTGTKVQVNLGPSSGLANQILAGAPADLFLSASVEWGAKVKAASQAEADTRLLTNRLVLIVPQGNPASVRKPQDLTGGNVQKIALAGEQVPAGKYADQALAKLGLLEKLVATGKIARGQDVRSALSYVARGEAEAGIVYSTDVAAAQDVETVYEFDPSLHDEIVYPLVLLKHGNANPAARKFYDFLRSPDANATYTQFGFSRIHESTSQP
jgi:molybdate transport system substrate-binding protein